MTPHALLATCTQGGVILKWDGSNLKVRGEQQAVTKLLPILRSHKAVLQAYFESDATDCFEERAAILEYDAGLSRADAEAQATKELQFWKNNRTYH